MKWVYVLMLALLVVGCAEQVETVDERPDIKYELTEQDVVTLLGEENFTSEVVSVMQVRLGDTKRQVIGKLGSPDNFTLWEGENLTIENLEYGRALNLSKIGLIVHLRNDEVTRITVDADFNKYLKGESQIEDSKLELYNTIGIPDTTQVMYKYIMYKYNSLGFDFVMFRGDESAMSLVYPSETNRTFNTPKADPYYIPYSDEIVFT